MRLRNPFSQLGYTTQVHFETLFCVANSILLEYREILELKTSLEVAENLLSFLTVHPYVEKYETYFDLALISGDPDDNKFCDSAFAAGAILVSNDGHFNVPHELGFPEISLISLFDFTDKYGHDEVSPPLPK